MATSIRGALTGLTELSLAVELAGTGGALMIVIGLATRCSPSVTLTRRTALIVAFRLAARLNPGVDLRRSLRRLLALRIGSSLIRRVGSSLVCRVGRQVRRLAVIRLVARQRFPMGG